MKTWSFPFDNCQQYQAPSILSYIKWLLFFLSFFSFSTSGITSFIFAKWRFLRSSRFWFPQGMAFILLTSPAFLREDRHFFFFEIFDVAMAMEGKHPRQSWQSVRCDAEWERWLMKTATAAHFLPNYRKALASFQVSHRLRCKWVFLNNGLRLALNGFLFRCWFPETMGNWVLVMNGVVRRVHLFGYFLGEWRCAAGSCLWVLVMNDIAKQAPVSGCW